MNSDCLAVDDSVEMHSHQSLSWKKLLTGNQGPYVCSSEDRNLLPKKQQVTRSQKQEGL